MFCLRSACIISGGDGFRSDLSDHELVLVRLLLLLNVAIPGFGSLMFHSLYNGSPCACLTKFFVVLLDILHILFIKRCPFFFNTSLTVLANWFGWIGWSCCCLLLLLNSNLFANGLEKISSVQDMVTSFKNIELPPNTWTVPSQCILMEWCYGN